MTPDKNKLYRFGPLTMEDVGLIEAMLGDGSIVEVEGPVYRQVKTFKLMTFGAAQALVRLLTENVLVEVGDEGETCSSCGEKVGSHWVYLSARLTCDSCEAEYFGDSGEDG